MSNKLTHEKFDKMVEEAYSQGASSNNQQGNEAVKRLIEEAKKRRIGS